MSSSCFWILGRGASIANGLHWKVPQDWYADLSRDDVIDRIKQTLRHQMDQPAVHRNAYRRLIEELSRRTSNDWFHRFLTTNWDTLLERELFPHARAQDVVPRWLGGQSHVYHLNGTIEEGANECRSPFLFEIDPAEQRVQTLEADQALCRLAVANHIIVVGMSFVCATDRAFLAFLNRIEDHMPVGEARVYIVNPDQSALDDVCHHVNTALPASAVVPIERGFDSFIEDGLTELVGTVLQ